MTLQHLLIAMLFSLSTATIAVDKPQRVVSINLCTDQLVMLLADPANITSISHLSLDKNSSYMAKEAATYAINHKLVEEVIQLKPDLVVAGKYMAADETRILKTLGYRVENFDINSSLADVQHSILRMAKLLGETARGEKMVAKMHQHIESVSEQNPHNKIPALVYYPRGYTEGKNTLMNELMQRAGYRNIAAEIGISGYGQISFEELLFIKPQQIIISEFSPNTRSLAQRYLHHPIMQQVFEHANVLKIDTRLLICGGPMNMIALDQMVEARHEH